jgi:LysR family transcriptional regulator, glycine cleavage system transcriptional activator
VIRKLPSLDLIRGFEAAARNLSFTIAAQELFVTQSAISRQIKALEEQLGVRLFQRRYRAILLTDAGQTLYRAVAEALRLIGDTTAQLQQASATKSVTVTCTIGFASLWLVPRLATFREQHPDVDLRISANNKMLDLERERIELAIRYCLPEKAPEGAIRLFGTYEVFPICSPALLKKPGKPLAKPEDLRHHVLLHLDDEIQRPTTAWPTWLEVVNLQNLKPAGSLVFTHDDHLVQAALDGQGVGLALGPLVRRFMKLGQLVAPFKQTFSSPRGYYLVAAKRELARPEVKDFISWMLKTSSGDGKFR